MLLSRCGWEVVWIFFLSSIISLVLSPSLWETVRYRLKYCSKGPFNPKQPTKFFKSVYALAVISVSDDRFSSYFPSFVAQNVTVKNDVPVITCMVSY